MTNKVSLRGPPEIQGRRWSILGWRLGRYKRQAGPANMIRGTRSVRLDIDVSSLQDEHPFSHA
ncbi:MAG: hypothetical protein O6942_05430, partial [Bacteroidetes bacterium]|nr:hypothetical protein [Bacteroidota bacterium]